MTGGPTGEQVTAARQGGPAGVEIRVGLATLLGLDHRPGEIPGWGPVCLDTARHLVTRQHRAPGRFAIVDDDGHLLLAGLTRHRPHPTQAATATPRSAAGQPGPAQAEGGLVELHVTATLLTALAHDPALFPAWAALITDLAAATPTDTDSSPPSTRIPTAATPADRCYATSRSATAPAPLPAAAARPTAAPPTTPTTGPWADPPPSPTPGPSAPATTPSNTTQAGSCANPAPAGSTGPARWGEHYTTRGEPVMPPLPEPCPPPLGSAQTPTAKNPPRKHPPRKHSPRNHPRRHRLPRDRATSADRPSRPELLNHDRQTRPHHRDGSSGPTTHPRTPTTPHPSTTW